MKNLKVLSVYPLGLLCFSVNTGENFCKTFIHRFDSERRLKSTQQVRDTPQFSESFMGSESESSSCARLVSFTASSCLRSLGKSDTTHQVYETRIGA
jgi:hypothetical protein